MAKLAYYDFGRILSHNGVFNFIAGARGLGKTYGAKRRVIDRALKHDEQFIYLRRFKTELKGRGTFFADIAHEFEGVSFRVHGNEAQAQIDGDDEWFTIGYFVSLSNAQAQKSVAFPKVTTIIFDEFIIEKGAIHYLPNEVKAFTDFYSTVDRYKDKTKVLFLANAISITNPYFIEYGITPDDGELSTKADGFIVAHFPDSTEFTRGVLSTRFGKFIEGTEYAAYAVGNQFRDNNKDLIDGKPPSALYRFTLHTRQGYFSCWHDSTGETMGRWYFQQKRPKVERLFTLEIGSVTEEQTYLPRNDRLLSMLRGAYNRGAAYFDTPQTRNNFQELYRQA